MNKMTPSIGFYGGTFDPIHLGHIQLALALKEQTGLERVYFCPTGLSPFKQQRRPEASSQDRLNMLRLAIDDIEGFDILEDEIESASEISYTIDTVEALKKKRFPHHQIRLILGKDMIKAFDQWKDYRRLLEIAPPLCGMRSCSSVQNHLNLEIHQTPLFDISATDIRERIKKDLYVKHLIPSQVFGYIKEKGIYIK